MSNDVRPSPKVLWRVAWKGEPVTIRSPVKLMTSTDGGNRWDDPCGRYGLLYAASDAESAICEVLAFHRRLRSATDRRLAEIEGVESDADLPTATEYEVLEWVLKSYELFELQCDEDRSFIDVAGDATLEWLAQVLPLEAQSTGLDGERVDRDRLRVSTNRAGSQPTERLHARWGVGSSTSGSSGMTEHMGFTISAVTASTGPAGLFMEPQATCRA